MLSAKGGESSNKSRKQVHSSCARLEKHDVVSCIVLDIVSRCYWQEGLCCAEQFQKHLFIRQ